MPLFTYRGKDSARGVELRKLHRDKHLAHLDGLDQAGHILFAGPLLDEAGQPCGSVIVMACADFAEARGIAESDPYLTEGIFESIEVHETKQVFPAG